MAVTESVRDLDAHTPDKLACIKRIGLEVRLRQDTMFDGVLVKEYESLALYNNVAQVCHVLDGFDMLATKASPPPGHEELERHMLFRARRRPDKVDIGLLQRWLNICSTEHSMTCEKAAAPQ